MSQIARHDEITQYIATIVSAKACRVFEDNVGALELTNTPKLRPRTKHLAIQLHHFRQHILDKTITVEKVQWTPSIRGLI